MAASKKVVEQHDDKIKEELKDLLPPLGFCMAVNCLSYL